MRTERRLIWGSVLAAILLATVLGLIASMGHRSEPPSWQLRDHSIIVTGDVILGRQVDNEILAGRDPFVHVEPVFARADQVIVNLESPLTDARQRLDKRIVLKARPENVKLLAGAGITAATLANNHISDYLTQGLTDTLTELSRAGIEHVGAGLSIDKAAEPLFLESGGVRVAVVNFSQYNDPTAPAATESQPGQAYFGTTDFQETLERASAEADFVIAVLHHGEEYQEFPDEEQIRMSRRAINFGADVVVGHHPHVTQGVEEYLGKPIFYSIGNFVFDQETEPWDRSFFVAIDLDQREARFTLYPYVIERGTPQFMSDKTAERFFARVNELSPVPIVSVDLGLGYLPPNQYGQTP